jgi:hypothetical protein
MAKLLIVHGVGFFESDEVLRRVGTFAPSLDLKIEDVSAFNWDKRVNRVFGRRKFDLGVLSRMSEGALRAANLGFSSDSSYAGIPRWAMVTSNACMLSIQTVAIFWLPVLLAAFFAKSMRWTGVAILAALLTSSLCLVIASKQKKITAGAVARRLALTCVWPILYFLAVTVTGIVMLALLIGYLRFSGFFQTHVDLLDLNGLLVIPIAVSLQVLLGLGTLFIGLGIEKIAKPLLKVISDVLRYIGLSGYRDRLLKECADSLRSSTAGCEHLIIYAHSLGSVIAVDTLLRYPDSLRNVKCLDLVTIGSPLKRLFSWGFPELFASPLAIHSALSGLLPEFRWVNVYRPLDFIGASIGSRNGPIRDRTTGQLFRNHTNYWGDPMVTEEVEKAFAETPYSHAETTQSVENWPIRLTASNYGSGVDTLWRFRDRISESLLLVLLLTCTIWILKSVPHTLGMFWTYRDSAFGGAFLIIVGILGVLGALWRLKGSWFKFILPFLRSFYGTLPDNNPSGIPDSSEDNEKAFSPPSRRFWLITSAVVSVPLLVFAWITYLERSWTPCSQPLGIADATALSLSDSGLLQVADLNYYWEYALPTLAKVTERQLPNGQYLFGFTKGSGDLVVERDTAQGPSCIVAVNRMTLEDISKPFCHHSIPAGLASVSNSGRFTAIISAAQTTGATTFRLLVWDGSRARERDFGEVDPSIRLQFGSNECLYYSQPKQVLQICDLDSNEDVHPAISVRARGSIIAFAVDGPSNLVTTIEDGRDLCVYAAGKRVAHMWALDRIKSYVPLISIASDRRTIALFAGWDVTLWNWKSYDYIGRYFAQK